TSARAVAAVAELVAAPVSGPRVAAVGRATAEAARAAGWEVDVVPAEETGTALVVALREAGLGPGSRVLLPISALGSDTVPAGLRGLGATVDRVTAYRTVPADLDRAACAAAIEGAEVDV